MTKTARKKRKKRKKLTSEHLRSKLKLKHLETKNRLTKKHPKVDKFFKEKGLEPGKVREHSAKIVGAGAIAGALLFSPPSSTKALPTPQELIKHVVAKEDKPTKFSPDALIRAITPVIPKKARPLDRQEEKILEQILEEITGIPTRATLESEHLNTTYGYIGAEQHLRRYPGDTLLQHSPKTDKEYTQSILESGIAPGLGAWGYFTPSKSDLTKELEETEKWYAVVQTLYLRDWNTRQPYLKNWYKYRKVLIVNTLNGNVVVAAISDSGPAAWTGKHFGGSPEVMHHLGGAQYKKGPTIVFFVDDPENKIPLGPVNYSE